MRELLRFLLIGVKCWFCRDVLLSEPSQPVQFGNGTAEPLEVNITQHHLDENHDNNTPENIVLSHQSCHKRHHALLVFRRLRGLCARCGKAETGKREFCDSCKNVVARIGRPAALRLVGSRGCA